MKKNASASAPLPAAAPEEPGSAFFLWAGMIAAASGSLIFNLSHDSATLKSILDTLAAGILPPFLSAVLGHAIKNMLQTWAKIAVFIVTIGAMVVSAHSTAVVLTPADGLWGGYLFSFVCDAADLMLLYGIIQHYAKGSAYRAWLAMHPDGVPATVPGHLVPAGPVVPGAQAAQAVVPAAEPVPVGVVPAVQSAVPAVQSAVPAADPEPVPVATVPAPGTVPAGEPGPVPGTPAPAVRTAGASRSPARPALPAAAGEPAAGESREDVVADLAARARPAAESMGQQARRAKAILDEFRARTGLRMNNGELGKALGLRKDQAGKIRKDLLADAEEEAA